MRTPEFAAYFHILGVSTVARAGLSQRAGHTSRKLVIRMIGTQTMCIPMLTALLW